MQAELPDLDSRPETRASDLSDSDEDTNEPPEKPKAPRVYAKLYAVPRDFSRAIEISAELDSKEVHTKLSGPDYGKDSASKFIHACKAAKEDTYFCVPYDGRKILSIGMQTGVIQEIGKTFRKEGAKYTEAVASTNAHGRMYAAPCRAQRILEIDSVTGSIKEVGPVLGSKKINKWWSIGASCNGRIYAIPYDAPRVLEIDPNRGGQARMVGPDLGTTPAKYCSIAEAPNGNLYCAPLNARQVLEIDQNGKVRLCGPDFGDTERKYACMVTAPNKLLYAPPLYADKVLEINCARGACREMGETIGCGEAKYCCAAVAPSNGKIYCAPLEARKVLEIDVPNGEVHQIGVDLGGADLEKYSSIAAAPEPCAKLFAAPRNAHQFLEICPRRAFVREVGTDFGRLHRKFSCIVPGAMWQGGKLWAEGAAIHAAKEEEYRIKLEKFDRRQASKAAAQALANAKRLSSKAGGSRRPSEAGSRSPSKMEGSRRPSKMGGSRSPSKTGTSRSPSKMEGRQGSKGITMGGALLRQDSKNKMERSASKLALPVVEESQGPPVEPAPPREGD